MNLKSCKITLVSLLTTFLLAGCSQTFTYNHLDWLIPWYVDDYVDISLDQKRFLKGELEPLLKWHREEELVRYVEILDRIEADLEAPVTADIVRSWVDEVIAAGERVEDNMLTLALEFSTTLSDEQMQEFTASLWEEQKEYEEEFLTRSDKEYVEENAEYLEDFLRKYIGRLSSEQQQRLLEGAQSMQRFDATWLAEHEAWLTTLEPLSQRPEGWQEAVLAAHANRNQSRPPEYEQIFDHNLHVLTHAVADVLNGMSVKQHQRAVKKINGLRAKILKLISR